MNACRLHLQMPQYNYGYSLSELLLSTPESRGFSMQNGDSAEAAAAEAQKCHRKLTEHSAFLHRPRLPFQRFYVNITEVLCAVMYAFHAGRPAFP